MVNRKIIYKISNISHKYNINKLNVDESVSVHLTKIKNYDLMLINFRGSSIRFEL